MYTRFNDAPLLASKEQFGAPSLKSRRAVIVLSDGWDNGQGTSTLEAALQAISRAKVTATLVGNTEISQPRKRAGLDQCQGGTEAPVGFNQVNSDGFRRGLP